MQDYDYIVVGAGSAGAVLASRLSENPRNKVLLVEAGGKTHVLSRFPLSFGLFIEKPGVNWLYQSEPEENTANRPIPVPRGKMLGGSSAINGLVWVRGQPLDYNTWAQMGARGWSWAVAPGAARAGRCASPKCPTRARSTTRSSRPRLRRATASTRTTTARTRKASSRPSRASIAACA
jgi:choline dehydrogenase-like flavoprotein